MNRWDTPRSLTLEKYPSDSTGLLNKEGYAVAVSSSEYTLAAANGTDFYGVCTNGNDAAAELCSAAREETFVRAGAAITAGARLTTDSTSRFITATGEIVVGFAMQTAGAAGEIIRAYIYPKGAVERSVGEQSMAIAVGTESSDVIGLTITGGKPGAEYFAIARNAAAPLESAASVFTMAETGDGAEITTTAKNGLGFTLSATGTAVVALTDVGGGSSLTAHVHFYPIGFVAPIQRAAATFDGS